MKLHTQPNFLFMQYYQQQNDNAFLQDLHALSSGYRIHTASDDVAGFSISEKMRGQIRGLFQAAKNTQNSVAVVQMADAALSESHALLQRTRELAVQAANSTYNFEDRLKLQQEMYILFDEIDNIANNTSYNSMSILNGVFLSKTNPMVVQIGANAHQQTVMGIAGKATVAGLGLAKEASATTNNENYLLSFSATIRSEKAPAPAPSPTPETTPPSENETETENEQSVDNETTTDPDLSNEPEEESDSNHPEQHPTTDCSTDKKPHNNDHQDGSWHSQQDNSQQNGNGSWHSQQDNSHQDHNDSSWHANNHGNNKNNGNSNNANDDSCYIDTSQQQHQDGSWHSQQDNSQQNGNGSWHSQQDNSHQDHNDSSWHANNNGNNNKNKKTQNQIKVVIEEKPSSPWDDCFEVRGEDLVCYPTFVDRYIADFSTQATQACVIPFGKETIYKPLQNARTNEDTMKSLSVLNTEMQSFAKTYYTDLQVQQYTVTAQSPSNAVQIPLAVSFSAPATVIEPTIVTTQTNIHYDEKRGGYMIGKDFVASQKITVNDQLNDALEKLASAFKTQYGYEQFQISNPVIEKQQSSSIVTITSSEEASITIDKVDTAIGVISEMRSQLGSYENHLAQTLHYISNEYENLSLTESRIRDQDLAKGMISFTKKQMLQKVTEAMFAQVSNSAQNVLFLLQ